MLPSVMDLLGLFGEAGEVVVDPLPFVAAPEHRRIAVPSESRTVVVPHESRTIAVEQESRTLIVP